ncbi:MAG: type II secretion system F family protein, partial [Nanoarchaeota archaeon]|nr:type II secretion system F family protein [Nanoarchaeota archaeon]
LAINLSKKHYHQLRQHILQADINMLSTTYISSIIFTTLLLTLIGLTGGIAYAYLSQQSLINTLLLGTATALSIGLLTYGSMYNAPLLIANNRRRAIKNDLPFVIIHMAAIAGSGAQPLSMFHLVQATGEYRGIEPEIKKILNYVNLFGYSLTSALRAVSITTPNKEFKDLLNGITAVIESGGDLKNYLKGKAEDAFNNYELERKRYIESLSTYSDVYAGVLLAAPLLFIVTLTIINLLGGSIGGFDVKTLAFFGTYIGLPVLNILFILFLNIIQPE